MFPLTDKFEKLGWAVINNAEVPQWHYFRGGTDLDAPMSVSLCGMFSLKGNQRIETLSFTNTLALAKSDGIEEWHCPRCQECLDTNSRCS